MGQEGFFTYSEVGLQSFEAITTALGVSEQRIKELAIGSCSGPSVPLISGLYYRACIVYGYTIPGLGIASLLEGSSNHPEDRRMPRVNG
jgi:hypothetical protein